jgi:hypothetical protein
MFGELEKKMTALEDKIKDEQKQKEETSMKLEESVAGQVLFICHLVFLREALLCVIQKYCFTSCR